MEKIVKIVWSQDAFFKTEPKRSGETSINLSNEIFDFLGGVENGYITFKIYKEDYIKALGALVLLLPLYKSSSKEATKVNFDSKLFEYYYAIIQNKFANNEFANYTIHLFKRDDGRIYLNELKENGTDFNIRMFFIQAHSIITFIKQNGVYEIRFKNSIEELSKNQDIEEEEPVQSNDFSEPYRPYITAIKSKPFLLLAGISGTGKSRIVRELARACWDGDDAEFLSQKPRNFEMIQVKPNWHDSSELIGYVSRVSGTPVFVAGDFLKFIARAWEEPDVPYFLCLDEMNLAPVEQYFAEYLSVIESRKADADGNITTDPILKKSAEDWFRNLTNELTVSDVVRNRFLNEGISIPQNLIVVGTVNMDETTFSFSRKVLDRAMTIEMNEVDLHGGLSCKNEQIGKLGKDELVGTAVEGVDIYENNKEVCDKALDYLQKVNDRLEGTPFKIAYRTRNEVLLYVVNNLPYKKEDETQEFVVARALDEITNMKILSRIEGDETKVSTEFLNALESAIKNGLEEVCGSLFADDAPYNAISLAKLGEMKKRLASGYTSFWS
jgi:hypothetical protein